MVAALVWTRSRLRDGVDVIGRQPPWAVKTADAGAGDRLFSNQACITRAVAASSRRAPLFAAFAVGGNVRRAGQLEMGPCQVREF